MAEKLVQLKKKGGGGGGITEISAAISQHIYSTGSWLTYTANKPVIGLVAYPGPANSNSVSSDILASWCKAEGYNTVKQSVYRNPSSGQNGTLQINVVNANTIQYRINGDNEYITRYGAYVYLAPIY